jgi:LPXTG-motif cell wall-anchored protein
VQPIDARAKDPAPRPCPNLEFLITLDEREWDKGTLAVEISSKGNGIIPDLGQCFGYERAGFDAEVVDGSLAVTELTSDGQGKSPKANRNWQITYKRKADYAGGPFILPQPLAAMPEAKLTYKVYRDTDLIELTPAEAAKGVALPGTGAGSKVWMVLGLILAILLALAILIPRRKKTLAVNASEISPPSEATPFATVAFLRRIKQTFAAKLGQDRSAELEAEIASIEARYFKRDATDTPDLEPVIRKWLAATRG